MEKTNDIETLVGSLQTDIKHGRELSAKLHNKLHNFRMDCPVILKDTKGYGYKYADLPTIYEVINPILDKHKLGLSQAVHGDTIITTLVDLETGHKEESSINIPMDVQLKGMNQFQVLGSAITYLRRYGLSTALGIATDKDTDAGGEQVSKAKPKAQPVQTANDIDF